MALPKYDAYRDVSIEFDHNSFHLSYNGNGVTIPTIKGTDKEILAFARQRAKEFKRETNDRFRYRDKAADLAPKIAKEICLYLSTFDGEWDTRVGRDEASIRVENDTVIVEMQSSDVAYRYKLMLYQVEDLNVKDLLRKLGQDAKSTSDQNTGWGEDVDDRAVSVTDHTMVIKATFSHCSGNGGRLRETYRFKVSDNTLVFDNDPDMPESCSINDPKLQKFVNRCFYFDGNC